MKLRLIAAAIAMITAPHAASAEEQRPIDLLCAVYGLWGVMDGTANFCWEVASYDVSYMEAHQNWLARNVIVRDELDAMLAAAGGSASHPTQAEAAGSTGIVDILRQATNKAEACGNWLASTNAGGYDAEAYVADQLDLLRERDGL